MEFEGYCVKCGKKRAIKQGTVTETSKGRPMAKGVCPECGTTVTRFLSDKESKKQPASQSKSPNLRSGVGRQ